MSRPKTRSDMVGFRLPVALYPYLLKRCEAKKETPSQYVERIVTASLEKDAVEEAAKGEAGEK